MISVARQNSFVEFFLQAETLVVLNAGHQMSAEHPEASILARRCPREKARR
jgi:hypothetical protein